MGDKNLVAENAEMKIQSALYLIPVGISEAPLQDVLPAATFVILKELKYFIVENIRTARRFIKKCNPAADIGELTFFELNRHTDLAEISEYLAPLKEGHAIGLMSEAGCPAVADPGSVIVGMAAREGLKVIPVSGPSSIIMSLMASGFNGQGFAFHGYLPVEGVSREKRIKELESQSGKYDMTQIFIETPYRNNKMTESLIKCLRPDTMLCVACDITDPENEEIVTLPVSLWRSRKYNFDKRPSVFLIYRKR